MNEFVHDSELPPELCFDPSCEDHNPKCAWDSGLGCDQAGVNWIGGRCWCREHTQTLEDQISALRELDAEELHPGAPWMERQ